TPKTAPGRASIPSSSGPRWMSASIILRTRRSASAASAPTTPEMPHIGSLLLSRYALGLLSRCVLGFLWRYAFGPMPHCARGTHQFGIKHLCFGQRLLPAKSARHVPATQLHALAQTGITQLM